MTLKFSIVKRFRCSQCNYLSSAGYLVDEVDCPWCKIPMERGLYKQYKNYCELIKEVNNHE